MLAAAVWFRIFLIPDLYQISKYQNKTIVHFRESWAIAVMAELVESLGYRKFCARWVPCFLAKEHKTPADKIFSHKHYKACC
jgi:hypothetical protein